MFHLFWNSIDWKIIGHDGMRFEKNFKCYSNDQLYKKQTWLNMTNILHALMLNHNIIDKKILITLKNLSQKA
jgi:hypothetical protein